MKIHIQTLLAATEGERAIEEFNTGSNVEVSKLLVFNGETEKVGGLSWHVDYT